MRQRMAVSGHEACMYSGRSVPLSEGGGGPKYRTESNATRKE